MTSKTLMCLGACLLAVGAMGAAEPAAAAGVSITSSVMAQQRSTAPDGTTRVSLVPASRVVPGDRVVFQLAYANGEPRAVDNLVLNNPVPEHLAYRGPMAGSPAPEVSVDGKTFAPLSALKVSEPSGAVRAARADEVTHVRWRIASAVPAGATGKLGFEATLK
jgi:hypothetical protein